MKKNLLILVGACMISGAAMAQQDNAMNAPAVYMNSVIVSLSPNGQWALSADGVSASVIIYDRKTGQKFVSAPETEAEMYGNGYGTCISNNGIAVGSCSASQDDASYFENGEWHRLPIRETDIGVCLSHGISADGSRIIGQVGRASWGLEEAVMQQPVIWYRNAENTGYDDYIELPYPTKDFLGATPQYVTAVCISEDGKKAAGQVMAGSGFYTQPIIYTENEDGTWSYELLHTDLMYDPSVELPEAPGDFEMTYPDLENYMSEEDLALYYQAMQKYEEWYASKPDLTNFMTEDEINAYNDALWAYYDDPFTNPYPEINEFASEEELEEYLIATSEWEDNEVPYPTLMEYASAEAIEEYNAYVEEYNAAAKEWNEKYNAYQDAFNEATANTPEFDFNLISLSGNGKWLTCTSSTHDPWDWSYVDTPYIFNLETNEYFALSSSIHNVGTYITNDGVLLATAPHDAYAVRNAYIYPEPGKDEYMALYDYVNSKNANLYEWMSENMRHTYYSEAWDDETGDIIMVKHEDAWCTGCPVGTPDLQYIATWELNQWALDSEDPEEASWFHSYVLAMDYTTGLSHIAASDLNVKAHMGGVVEISGKASSLRIYDVNGRLVYSNDAPEASIATGLSHGMYIIKATDANGKAVITKAAI